MAGRRVRRSEGSRRPCVVFPTWRQNDADVLPPAVAAPRRADPAGRGGAGGARCATTPNTRRSTRPAIAGLEQRLRAAGAVGLSLARRRDARPRPRDGKAGADEASDSQAVAAPPEDSIALRVVVAVAVEVAIVAVVAQPRAVEPLTAVAALILAPLGYLFSYRRRDRSSVILKIAAVGGPAGRARPVHGVGERRAISVDQARLPLATLFLWVQVLHAFDVPRRRDLAFSMVSSLILMAEAASLSLVVVVPGVPGAVDGLAGRVALAVVARPRPDQVTRRSRCAASAPHGESLPGWRRRVRRLTSTGGRRARGLPRLPGDAARAGHRSCGLRRSR